MPVLTTADFAALDDVDLDDLYANLAIADAGTQPDLGMAMHSLAMVRTSMAADSMASAISLGGLIAKGKALFNRYWPTVKEAVCKVWNDHGEDWLGKAADAVAAILHLPAAVIAFVLKIAVKRGMELVCGADAAPQPA